MPKKNLKPGFIYAILGVFFLLGIVYAQEQATEQPTSKTAPQETQKAVAQAEKEKVEISSETVAKIMPAYNLNLKQLIKEAERNIKKVDEKIREQETFQRNQEREAKAREHFEKGNLLYSQGELKGAKEEWQQAIEITKDPEMKGYVQEAKSKAKEEGLAKKRAAAQTRRQEEPIRSDRAR